MRIPKIFLSSKSDNFKSFKPYFESINWLVKVFYSSSFFGEFLFLILSHTEIPMSKRLRVSLDSRSLNKPAFC